MGRHYWSKKQEADYLNKIPILLLKKHGFLMGGYKSGVVTWTNKWSGAETKIDIVVNVFGTDNHMELSYTQANKNETSFLNYKIPLVTTPCYFGGVRYWFSCPASKNGVYCGKRVAVLYKGGTYLACRHCYDLSYDSRNENKRYKDYPLFAMLTGYKKLEELESKIKRKFYAGKPTRKQRRLNRLRWNMVPYAIAFNKSGSK